MLLHGVRNYLLAARNELATRNQVSTVITEAANWNCNLSVASRYDDKTDSFLARQALPWIFTSKTLCTVCLLSSAGVLSTRDTFLASFVRFPIPFPYFLNVASNGTFQCETVRRHSSATEVFRVKRPPKSRQSPRLGHEAMPSPWNREPLADRKKVTREAARGARNAENGSGSLKMDNRSGEEGPELSSRSR